MRLTALMAAIGLAFLPARAQESGESAPETIVVESSVDLGAVDEVEVAIATPVGDLEVEGGAAALAEAVFVVGDIGLVPVFEYEEAEGEGRLELALEGDASATEELESRWSVQLNSGVLEELNVSVGVGRCELELGAMPRLEEVEASVGAGQLVVDCSGPWGRSPEALELAKDADDGDSRHVELSFEVGVGDCRLVVPADVGVLVHAEAELGDVVVSGLEESEDGWVNGLWDTVDVNLEIEAEVGIGDLLVEVAEPE
jgi:hypothetical protein